MFDPSLLSLLCFSECKIDNCEACFNRNFCTKCKEGLYSHSGRCYVSCPPGQRTANETMECVGQHALECELGEWSQWSSCMKKNKTCGFKKGSQFRVRAPLQQTYAADSSSTFEETCTSQSERRKCVVPKTPCAFFPTSVSVTLSMLIGFAGWRSEGAFSSEA
uniref:R-spondin Fu-CRD domain-containing protein n=1 Tax=Oryzias sinensis TaxID=183150 RepID=A0A8C7WU80_9TELE